MNFRTKDGVNFARNLPQSKEISATLGRKVEPFIMSVYTDFSLLKDFEFAYLQPCTSYLFSLLEQHYTRTHFPPGSYYTVIISPSPGDLVLPRRL